MPAIAFVPPEDGRQSDTAREVVRGTRRLLRARNIATVTELVLADGRRADIVGLGPDGSVTIVEVKSTVADFRADRKWSFYRAFCDRLFFAIPVTMPAAIMPDETGLIVAGRLRGRCGARGLRAEARRSDPPRHDDPLRPNCGRPSSCLGRPRPTLVNERRFGPFASSQAGHPQPCRALWNPACQQALPWRHCDGKRRDDEPRR